MTPTLSIRGLSKRYRDFVLGPFDFDVEPGRVVALIGPNGSGKTTFINMIAGLIRPDAGHVEISGIRVDQRDPRWKFDIGYIGDEPVFYERWSGAKNLKFVGQFFPDWSDARALELARRFDLDLEKKAFELSKGNRAKLYLITVLARSPKLLVFDEPTSGLDPVVRAEVLDVLWETIERGDRSVLFATHILSDVQRIADEIAFLIKGKIELRRDREALTDGWRRVSFQIEGEVELAHVFEHRREASGHVLITPDFETTYRELEGKGANHIESAPLSLEEVAVQILKERVHAATN